MWTKIFITIAAFGLYFWIGLLIGCLFGDEIDEPHPVVVVLWPIVLSMLGVVYIFSLPAKLAEKIKNKKEK